MKRPQTILAAMVSAIVVLVAIVFAVNNVQAPSSQTLLSAGPSGQAQPTAVTHYGPEAGALTDTLVSPDNISLHVVELQRGANQWLFHIHVHNNTNHSLTFQDVETNHYFVLVGKGAPGVPYTFSQLTVALTAPAQASGTSHRALPPTVVAKSDVDGWLVADLSSFKYQPIQLLYVYGTVTDLACTNPQDQTTCHPSTGYRTLLWRL